MIEDGPKSVQPDFEKLYNDLVDALRDDDRLAEFASKCRQYPNEPAANLFDAVFGDVVPVLGMSPLMDDPRFQDGYEPPEPHFDDDPTPTLHGPQ
jgi:hypothetical protein